MTSSIIIHPEELSKKWIDRMVDGGVTVLGLHPRGGAEAAETLAELVRLFETEDFRELIDYAVERGLEIECEMHAARYLLPKELFADHPEYFRMNEKGERVTDFNLCFSCDEALDILAKNAVALAKKLYRVRPVFYFWLDDAVNASCTCPKCRELSTSDQHLTAVNRMITEIRKVIPEAKMSYLAYRDSLEVPTKVKPAEGVFLEYAPIEKYKTSAVNRIDVERDMLLKQAEFFGWKDSKVLEYWLDNSLFSRWKKPPVRLNVDREKALSEIKEYASLGFESIATFGCFLGQDYEELYGEADISAFTDGIKEIK